MPKNSNIQLLAILKDRQFLEYILYIQIKKFIQSSYLFFNEIEYCSSLAN